MVGWYVKTQIAGKPVYVPCENKETAEDFAERTGGEAVSIDEYARQMIENSRNIIYRNQEGRMEKDRRRAAAEIPRDDRQGEELEW